MPSKKRNAKPEPLLHSVARQLGHAAGVLSNITHGISDAVSEVPATLAARKNEVAKILSPAATSDSGNPHRKKASVARSPRKRTASAHRTSKAQKKARPKARRKTKPSERKNKRKE
jgi:hypothetical protein